jgi:hypothetical protein
LEERNCWQYAKGLTGSLDDYCSVGGQSSVGDSRRYRRCGWFKVVLQAASSKAGRLDGGKREGKSRRGSLQPCMWNGTALSFRG